MCDPNRKISLSVSYSPFAANLPLHYFLFPAYLCSCFPSFSVGLTLLLPVEGFCSHLRSSLTGLPLRGTPLVPPFSDASHPWLILSHLLSFATSHVIGACLAATASTLQDLHILGEPMLSRILGSGDPDCLPPINLATHKLRSMVITVCGPSDHATSDCLPSSPDMSALLTRLTLKSSPKSEKLPVALTTLLGDRTTLTHLTPPLHPPASLINEL